jgi:hypothetical protein
MTKAPSTRRLRIPVKYVGGVWECAFGGAIPIAPCAEAELVVDRRSIVDDAFLEAMEKKGQYKVLEEGTRLLVSLTIKPESPPSEVLRPILQGYDSLKGQIATEFLDMWNPGSLCFVGVKLAGPDAKQAHRFNTDRGGLWLITQGVQAIGLASTAVVLPEAISTKPVASLNHAFTKLSETYETWRISHTGNVYTRVFYSGTERPMVSARIAAESYAR